MKIEVALFATLMCYMPEKNIEKPHFLEINEGATPGDIFKQLGVTATAVKLILVNGIHGQEDQILKDGDRIGVFPPISGG